MADAAPDFRLVVLVSGRGSNLRAILDAIADGHLRARVAAVISNRPDAQALQHAARHEIPRFVLYHRDYASRPAYDAALADLIEGVRPDLVVLAGFMRLLSPAFVDRFPGRMVNIHPSLLPAFPGLQTHERALAGGVRIHGATVHYVTHELDSGPIIVQAAVPVRSDDTPARLAERVLAQEHLIYPLALEWIRQGKVRLANGRVIFRGQEQMPTGLVVPPPSA